MRFLNKKFIFSPSDLVTFFDSEFASYMNHFVKVSSKKSLKEKGVFPDPPDPLFEIITKMGIQHEKEMLQVFEEKEILEDPNKKTKIVEIDREKEDYKTCHQKTLSAMQEGVDLIYQGAISQNLPFIKGKTAGMTGYVDILEKTKGDSALGDYHYTPYDVKISVHPSPQAILQLCCYSDTLQSIQKVLPQKIKIITKDETTHSFETHKFFAFYELLKQKFLDYHSRFDSNQFPIPVKQEDHKNWNIFARKTLHSLDDISLVAEIKQSQALKLKKAGFHTMTELSKSSQKTIPKMANSSYKKLKNQARLQVISREQKKIFFNTIHEEGQGLESLPPPDPADIFFDMEGYPLLGEEGLEYLYGNIILEKEKTKFVPFWAKDKSQELLAFKNWIEWAYARYEKNPKLHIYHYGHYEPSTLKRLMCRYGVGEFQVDNLLGNDVFVDLYRVVKQGLVVGLYSYSLKEIEKLYYPKRKTEVQSGGDSAVQFFHFLNSKDQAETFKTEQGLSNENQKNSLSKKEHETDQTNDKLKAKNTLSHNKQKTGQTLSNHESYSPFLKQIEDYNKDDCLSTYKLCQFLWDLQKKEGLSYRIKKEKTPEDKEPKKDEKLSCQKKARELLSHIPLEKRGLKLKDNEAHFYVAELLASLLEFHIREDKPSWWRYFEYFKTDEFEKLEDRNIISSGHLVKDEDNEYEIHFESDQEFDFQRGDKVAILENDKPFEFYQITELDLINSSLCLKPPKKSSPLPKTGFSLVGTQLNVYKKNLFKSLLKTANEFSPDAIYFGLNKAIHDLLLKAPPDLPDHEGSLVRGKKSLISDVSKHVLNLRDSVLCIQGPPGSGKTWTASHIILNLIKKGKRVGVTSNSHKAILNLLKVLCEQNKNNISFVCEKICQSSKKGEEEKFIGNLPIELVAKASQTAQVVGATTYFFSRDTEENSYDYLFIDEASQVSLANTVAAGRSAKNIILLGDQNQLDQPIQASHPGESGQSALSYYTDGQGTIPEDRGVFLPTSYRLQPEICRFISDHFYDGNLTPDPDNKNQKIILPANLKGKLPDKGVCFIPVDHSGNREASWEEVEVLSELYDKLLKASWQDKNNDISPLTAKDILIVAPYNLQVSYIKKKIKHPGLRVASVDKFQGQEAPISILSLSSSSLQESARGIDFLFNKNRLNVSLSRAKALAIVIGSKNLLDTRLKTIAHIELMNTFCQITKQN